jgi:DNA (cytosine-5)-methyltransferase 1
MAGFHVTGVDIAPQKHYCGDEFHQADALTFPIEGYDFIWASPPCQAFTALRFMPTAKDHPNLIPETRARLVASGIPYCIENVEGAPLGESGYLTMLCGTMFGLQTADGRAELRRHRLFETSFSIPVRPKCQHGAIPLGVYGGHLRDRCRNVLAVVGHTPVDNKRTISVTGEGGRKGGMKGLTLADGSRERQIFTTQQAREAMGIDWMPMSKLSQAIPPAYSEFIGRQALQILKAAA